MSKFRMDFVTNSSSSSFICEICGNMESGMDMSISEAGMVRCVNGHEFCEDHKLDSNATFESRKQNVLSVIEKEYKSDKKYFKSSGSSWAKERMENAEKYLKLLKDISEDEFDELYDEIVEEYEDEFNCVQIDECPICQLKNFVENELISYFLKENSTTMEIVTDEIKNKFETYEKFKEYLK